MLNAGFQQVGKDFPVFLHPDTKEEYALARTERKTAHGHRGFDTFTSPDVSLEDDLARRDLTINAIAQDASGALHDPYGGLVDMAKRHLRHVTDAFREDPLRVLRTARFAARFHSLGFTIAPETLALMSDISARHELQTLSPERVWKETEKALCMEQPRIYFEALRHCGALAQLFPEIDALFGIEQRPDYHPEIDTGLHTLLTLDQICEQTTDPCLRFAALVHDLGKATTPKEMLPSHPGHEERSAELIHALCDRLRVPNAFRHIAVRVGRHHLNCHRALELKPTTLEKLLGHLDAWRPDNYVLGFVQCCMADARGRTGLETRPYPQYTFLLECAEAANAIDTQALRNKGLEGTALGDAIRQQRVAQIQDVKKRYAHVNEKKFALGQK